MQLEMDKALEDNLAAQAGARGLRPEELAIEFLRTSLHSSESASSSEKEVHQAQRDAAIDVLKNFGRDHGFTLGTNLTVKDLIDEGRRL